MPFTNNDALSVATICENGICWKVKWYVNCRSPSSSPNITSEDARVHHVDYLARFWLANLVALNFSAKKLFFLFINRFFGNPKHFWFFLVLNRPIEKTKTERVYPIQITCILVFCQNKICHCGKISEPLPKHDYNSLLKETMAKTSY